MDLFNKYRNLGLPVSGPLFRSIAAAEAKKLCSKVDTPMAVKAKYEVASFGPSWLRGFKERNGIRGNIRMNGERASLPGNIDELMIPILDIIQSSQIPISNIYNWDETGLFYRGMPRYTLAVEEDDGAGSKQDKKRITAMLSVNGDGSDTTVVLIGTAKKPCGTNAKFWLDNNVDYYSNKTAWMTGEIFETLLQKFDKRMTGPTILILDNFSGHFIDMLGEYEYIIPLFLPPNTTSKTQPLDAGIISTCKVKYRFKLMNYVLDRVSKNDFRLNDITIQRIVPWFAQAAAEIKPSTIQKCFYNSLKLDMFLQQASSPMQPEIIDDLTSLQDTVGLFFGDQNPPDLIQISNFGMIDAEYAEENVSDDEEQEHVIVADPKLFTEGSFTMAQLRTYWRNTGCVREEKCVDIMMEKLFQHLNFQ